MDTMGSARGGMIVGLVLAAVSFAADPEELIRIGAVAVFGFYLGCYVAYLGWPAPAVELRPGPAPGIVEVLARGTRKMVCAPGLIPYGCMAEVAPGGPPWEQMNVSVVHVLADALDDSATPRTGSEMQSFGHKPGWYQDISGPRVMWGGVLSVAGLALAAAGPDAQPLWAWAGFALLPMGIGLCVAKTNRVELEFVSDARFPKAVVRRDYAWREYTPYDERHYAVLVYVYHAAGAEPGSQVAASEYAKALRQVAAVHQGTDAGLPRRR